MSDTRKRARDTRGERTTTRERNLDSRHRGDYTSNPGVLLRFRCVLPWFSLAFCYMQPRLFHYRFHVGFLLPSPYKRCSFCYPYIPLLHIANSVPLTAYFLLACLHSPLPPPCSPRVPSEFASNWFILALF